MQGHRPPRRPRARSSPCSDRTARARPPPWRSSKATARATAGRAQRARSRSRGDMSRPSTERIGIVLQSTGVDPYLTVQETIELYSGYYPNPRPAGEVIDLVGLGSKADTRVTQALGRPAAPPRRRDRARRRPRAPVPGRADHRVRSQRPPRRVGHRQEPHRTRQDRVPHDAFHGRGAVPRRSAGRDGARARSSPRERRRRSPAVIGCWPGSSSASARRRTIPPPWGRNEARTARGRSARRIRRGHCTSSRAGPSSTAIAFDALEVTRPSLEDVYLDITGGEVVPDE